MKTKAISKVILRDSIKFLEADSQGLLVVVPPAHQETIAAAQDALNVFHRSQIQHRTSNAIKSAVGAEAFKLSFAPDAGRSVLRCSKFRPEEKSHMKALQAYIVHFLHTFGHEFVNDLELQVQLGAMADQMEAKYKGLL